KTISLQQFPAIRWADGNQPSNQSGANGSGQLYLTDSENAEVNTHLKTARDTGLLGSVSNALAAAVTPVPDPLADFHYWGMGGTVKLKVGTALLAAAKIAGDVFSITAAYERDQAGIASRTASYQRRADEWMFQANLAAHELMQMGRQIIG